MEELPALVRASRGGLAGIDHLWKQLLALGIDLTVPGMVSGIGNGVVSELPNLTRIIGKVPQALFDFFPFLRGN